MKRITLLPVVAALGLTAPTFAQTFPLTLIPADGMSKIGYYMPQPLTLSAQKPVGLKRTIAGATNLRYGTLKFGQGSVIVAVQETADGKATFYVDANRDGDLTNDAPIKLNSRSYDPKQGFALNMGNAKVQMKAGKNVPSLQLSFYKFDARDKQRAALKDTLLYYRDYATEGQITLGGKPYHILLDDAAATGTFMPMKSANTEKTPGITLLIDVNGNGKIDSRGERYDVNKPFNIGGTTYEIKQIAADGTSIQIVKSTQTVAEILPPPTLAVGKPALTFDAKTTTGDTVSFPKSYPGKIVMLDFWATWCGPCIGELPGLTRAYETYHPKGFEILGISLDQENAAAKVADFTKSKNMPWAQVYDGKFWQAEVAQLYVVDSIPRAYLVDGDTGAILAEGDDLRGEKLVPTLERILATRNK